MGRTNRLYLPSQRPTAHTPTKVSRLKVRAWAEVGTSRAVIAHELGISTTTLTNHYGVELAQADERGVAQVASALYAKALGGDVTAMIHFLKKRGKKHGWGDDPGEGGQTTNILQLNLVKSITQAVSQMRQQGGEAAQMLIEGGEVLEGVVESVTGIHVTVEDDGLDLI